MSDDVVVEINWDTWHTQSEYALKDLNSFHQTLHTHMRTWRAMHRAAVAELERATVLGESPERILELFRFAHVADGKRQAMAFLHDALINTELAAAKSIPAERLAEDPELADWFTCTKNKDDENEGR